jgi:undecaprenyl-diphosphatase
VLALRSPVAEGGNSTPSGHTTDSTALFVALALIIVMLAWRQPIVTRVVSALAVLLSVGIGLSRLELGVHWPLDVVLGWMLGLGIAVGTVEVGAAVDRRLADRPPLDGEVGRPPVTDKGGSSRPSVIA